MWAPRGTCAIVVGSLGSLAEWRRVRILYSAFLLAVVELDSSGALEWIVERIEGSIPHFFLEVWLCLIGSCMCDVLLACSQSDLDVC